MESAPMQSVGNNDILMNGDTNATYSIDIFYRLFMDSLYLEVYVQMKVWNCPSVFGWTFVFLGYSDRRLSAVGNLIDASF